MTFDPNKSVNDDNPLPVTGTLTAIVDESTLATSAKQDTGNTSLATIATNQTPSVSTSAGITTTLNTTNATQITASSVAAKLGVEVCAPLANTKPVYVACGSAVTTATGIEILPGQSKFFPVSNANQLYAITGTATQVLQSVVF